MNPHLRGQDLRDVFDTKDYNVLIVANKYQTGFDQPKLVGMYVDKKLSSVAAVQTLSRLNRIYPPEKDLTFILDFANKPEEIQQAFEPFYKKAQLTDVTDLNIIHDIQAKLDAERIYTTEEIENFILAYFKGKQSDMQAAIAPAVDRYRKFWDIAIEEDHKKDKDRLENFRKYVGSFVRLYDFLSQIVDYADTDLEKRAIFFRHLLPWLRPGTQHDPLDLSSVVMTHYRLNKKSQGSITLQGETRLDPIKAIGTAEARDAKQDLLSQIIEQMNDLFSGEITDGDRIGFVTYLREKMMESEVLAQQAAANTKEQFSSSPDFRREMENAAITGMENHQEMVRQMLSDDQIKARIMEMLADLVWTGFQSKDAQNRKQA